ncbi:MAG TPA: pitrilysin family protein [Rhizomicrobium sp.]|nr:pitrilysin family protein [Rhizomicrobium sp.]
MACATLVLSLQARADSPKVFQFALQNGMQVVVVPDHRAPVVTQMLWFRVGGVDDPPGISGLAHFFEHMMFRGTKAVPGEGFAQTIARNGGVDNAETTHDYTLFYEQIAKDRLPLAMQLEADRMVNLDLSDTNVMTERNVVAEERRMRVDNDPQSMLGEQMSAQLYMGHPYGRPVIGWMEEIKHIDRLSARDFYRHHYAPNNAILVLAGDITPDEARKAAQTGYGKVPARELSPRWDFAQPPRMGETRLSVTRSDAKLPVMARSYRVKSYTEARPGEAEALEVYAALLGGDVNSTLYRKLVVEKKIAVEAGASYDGMTRDSGEFSLYAVPRPGVSLEALERAMDAVIADQLARPIDAAALTRTKTQLIASAIYRKDSQYAMAQAYGQALVIGLTVDDVDEWPARIRAVSADAVRKAGASLNRREAVTAYLKPASALAPARRPPQKQASAKP